MILKEKEIFRQLKEHWEALYRPMTTFCILEKNNEIEIVKMGFSWKAFFFNFVWGLSHKIWLFSLIWFSTLLISLISFFVFWITLNSFFLNLIFSSFFWGIYGNDILLFYLVRKMNFVPKKIISSQNSKTAFYSYILER